MTTPVINLTVSQPASTTVQASIPTSTATVAALTSTTTLPPPPPQPQQGYSDSILIQRIGELEQLMADLVQANLALEERMDKHGSRLYKLENLDIPHQVSKAVDEIVTDAVDWAIQAPLRDRFRDLPEADMKEILHHRMWESNSYKAHEDHKNLYEALEQSMARDHTDQLLTDLAEARKKKKKRHDSPKTPPGSPPHQPPPPPPPAGPSGTSGASGSSQLPPPPPLLSTNQSDQSTSIAAPSSSKTAASAEYTAWTTTNTRLKPPATPEPAWSIPSSDLPVPVNNWASALASTYAPPPENLFYFAQLVGHVPKGRSINYNRSSGLESPSSMYDYMKTIVLRRADLNEYIIAERDFKYLYPSDFEDLQLMDQKLGDQTTGRRLPTGIESYQTQLNLTKPRWDATGFEFKHDFTVINSSRAVTFRDKYGVQMIMRFNEIHKFSDGTLQQIDEALDYRVKEFKVNRMNPGLNTRFWIRKDVERSKEFMFAIQKRLKTKRIFRNLESFVGGRIREGDYRPL
ncbi:hypothetical protein Tco_0067226 [Tanacetum coccineum]